MVFLVHIHLVHAFSAQTNLLSVHAITARLNPLKHYLTKPSFQSTSSSSSLAPFPPGAIPSSHRRPSAPTHAAHASIGAIVASATSNPMRIRPDPPAGLEVLESETFRMQCFNTLTGTKFLIFTELGPPGGPGNIEGYLRKIYDLYADYVTKNPFYQLDMPIRCDIFDRRLGSFIREINSR